MHRELYVHGEREEFCVLSIFHLARSSFLCTRRFFISLYILPVASETLWFSTQMKIYIEMLDFE